MEIHPAYLTTSDVAASLAIAAAVMLAATTLSDPPWQSEPVTMVLAASGLANALVVAYRALTGRGPNNSQRCIATLEGIVRGQPGTYRVRVFQSDTIAWAAVTTVRPDGSSGPAVTDPIVAGLLLHAALRVDQANGQWDECLAEQERREQPVYNPES